MTSVSAKPRSSARSPMRAVFLHHLRRTRRAWGSMLASGLASPTLFLLAIGGGLGSQIDDLELAALGVDSYMDYIGPGVLVVTAMQVAATESMWPTMGLLRWEGVYKAIVATPISSQELGTAHTLWIGFRAVVTAICFLAVLGIAGALSSLWAIAIAPLALLVAWAHAAPMVAIVVGLKQENLFAMINRIVVFPLFLFSGAFFPVEDMPAPFTIAAKATPTWHGVEAARHFATGDVGGNDVAHVGYLTVFVVIGFLAVRRQFPRHLDV